MFVFVCVVVSVFVCLFVIVFVLMFVFVLFFVLVVVFAKPATRRPIMGKRANPPAPSRRMGTMANPPALSKAKPANRRRVKDWWFYEPFTEVNGTTLIAQPQNQRNHGERDKVTMDGDSSADADDDCFCYYWDLVLVDGKCIGRCELPNYRLQCINIAGSTHCARFCTTSTWDEPDLEVKDTPTVARRSKLMVMLPKAHLAS